MESESIGAYEAKTHLPRLLDDVASGRSYVITKHGVPVARLVPAEQPDVDPGEVIRELRELRRGITIGDLSIREMIEEGRR
jgi:prevent-host-death family protein